MSKINSHPILDVPKRDKVVFTFNGKKIEGEKGFTIAAALHQAGYPVHSHSLDGRGRSLACGIGKCGACEMLVDGKVRRICVTKVDGVKEVREFVQGEMAEQHAEHRIDTRKVLRTTVVIVGAGPAGLAVREEFEKYGIDNIVIDNNDKIGGQFNMQTHQFFFFEKEKRFGGMRYCQNLGGGEHGRHLLEFYGLGYFGGETSGCEKLGNGCRVFRGCRLSGCGHGGRTVYAGF